MINTLILLAGGRGSRLGTPKGLLVSDGEPWFSRQWRCLLGVGEIRVVVVLGHCAEDYLKRFPWLYCAVGGWTTVDGIGLSVAINQRPELGQFSSLQAGGCWVDSGNESGVFVCPIDVPIPSATVFGKLRNALIPGIAGCLPTYLGKPGHPVLLSSKFFRSLMLLDPECREARLDSQLRARERKELAYIPVEDFSVIQNLNTVKDFEIWSRYPLCESGLLFENSGEPVK